MIDGASANVTDFGAVGDGITDSTAAFKAAIASGAKSIYIPTGTYLTDFTNPTYRTDGILFIPSGVEFFGDGESSVLRPYTNQTTASGTDAYGCLGTDSGDVAVFSEGLVFRDLKFYGWSETTTTVNEHAGLLYLSSVKRVLIERCYFVAPRGDAIQIATGYGAGPSNERYNYDITIRDCVFDGVNNKNRNAISVIDVNGINVEGCTFRNFTDSAMPGSIDFEPNDSYSVIKNVFVSNNNFESCGGANGHVIFAVDNISTLNQRQENWIIVNNKFSDAEAAVYILTEKTAPSVSPTTPQNILIANNVATNVTYFINKFKGSVTGITVANNTVVAYSSGQGVVQFGNSTADWTLKDCVIIGNTFACLATICLAITDNIEDLTVSNNIMRGSTQAHMRFGTTGTSTTSIVVTDNQLIGTPSNYLCQHDATTYNQSTNLWRNNRAPSTVPNNFRGYAVDVTGIVQNTYTTATLPSEFPYGESVGYLNSVNVGSATLTGIVKTYKHSSLNSTNIYQIFWPTYDATYLNDFYFRKAIDASTWAAWYNVVGV